MPLAAPSGSPCDSPGSSRLHRVPSSGVHPVAAAPGQVLTVSKAAPPSGLPLPSAAVVPSSRRSCTSVSSASSFEHSFLRTRQPAVGDRSVTDDRERLPKLNGTPGTGGGKRVGRDTRRFDETSVRRPYDRTRVQPLASSGRNSSVPPRLALGSFATADSQTDQSSENGVFVAAAAWMKATEAARLLLLNPRPPCGSAAPSLSSVASSEVDKSDSSRQDGRIRSCPGDGRAPIGGMREKDRQSDEEMRQLEQELISLRERLAEQEKKTEEQQRLAKEKEKDWKSRVEKLEKEIERRDEKQGVSGHEGPFNAQQELKHLQEEHRLLQTREHQLIQKEKVLQKELEQHQQQLEQLQLEVRDLQRQRASSAVSEVIHEGEAVNRRAAVDGGKSDHTEQHAQESALRELEKLQDRLASYEARIRALEEENKLLKRSHAMVDRSSCPAMFPVHVEPKTLQQLEKKVQAARLQHLRVLEQPGTQPSDEGEGSSQVKSVFDEVCSLLQSLSAAQENQSNGRSGGRLTRQRSLSRSSSVSQRSGVHAPRSRTGMDDGCNHNHAGRTRAMAGGGSAGALLSAGRGSLLPPTPSAGSSVVSESIARSSVGRRLVNSGVIAAAVQQVQQAVEKTLESDAVARQKAADIRQFHRKSFSQLSSKLVSSAAMAQSLSASRCSSPNYKSTLQLSEGLGVGGTSKITDRANVIPLPQPLLTCALQAENGTHSIKCGAPPVKTSDMTRNSGDSATVTASLDSKISPRTDAEGSGSSTGPGSFVDPRAMSLVGDTEHTSSIPSATPLHVSRLITPETSVPRETLYGDTASPLQQTSQDSVCRTSCVLGASSSSTVASGRSFRDIPAFLSPRARQLTEDMPAGGSASALISSRTDSGQTCSFVGATVPRPVAQTSATQVVLSLPNSGEGAGRGLHSGNGLSQMSNEVDAERDATAVGGENRSDSAGGTVSNYDSVDPRASVPSQRSSVRSTPHSPRGAKNDFAPSAVGSPLPLLGKESGGEVSRGLAGSPANPHCHTAGGAAPASDSHLITPLRVPCEEKPVLDGQVSAGPTIQSSCHQGQVVAAAAVFGTAPHGSSGLGSSNTNVSCVCRAQPGDVAGDEGAPGFWDEDDLDEWKFDDVPAPSFVEQAQLQPPTASNQLLGKPATLQGLFERTDGCPASQRGAHRQLETALGATSTTAGMEGMPNGVARHQERVDSQHVVGNRGGGGVNSRELSQMQQRPVSAPHRSIEDLFA
ncbi:hypothetical protein CSUI_007504 [Cystoisospora suis]|uniref:Uncharacterized protein n=1 Tax=Cystoisospora suis TaxID=483139 RepID=A0A2C6KDS7_9APIC|nr:hypothetical protein CSUI_007504 [Cystoisospora suis]